MHLKCCIIKSAVDGEDEADTLPTRRPPTPSRGQVPGGGPQSAVDGEDEAGKLPAHRPPTPSRHTDGWQVLKIFRPIYITKFLG